MEQAVHEKSYPNVFKDFVFGVVESADVTKYNFLEYFFKKPRLRADGIMPITSHSLQNIVPFTNGLGPRMSALTMLTSSMLT